MSAAPIELLPCPFCGGPPVPRVHHYGAHFAVRDLAKENDGLSLGAHVWCHECGAEGPKTDKWCFDAGDYAALEAEGVRLWNDRALKNIALYVAGYDDKMHVYPRPDPAAR